MKIQGYNVVKSITVDGEKLTPFSDKEYLYIPQLVMHRNSNNIVVDGHLIGLHNDVSHYAYWLAIPLSVIRGNIGDIDMVVNAPEEMKIKF